MANASSNSGDRIDGGTGGGSGRKRKHDDVTQGATQHSKRLATSDHLRTEGSFGNDTRPNGNHFNAPNVASRGRGRGQGQSNSEFYQGQDQRRGGHGRGRDGFHVPTHSHNPQQNSQQQWRNQHQHHSGQQHKVNNIQPKNDFQLSKTMAFLLRHGAQRARLQIQPDGYMLVKELLKYKDIQHYTLADVKRVVEGNNKKRFQLTETEPGVFKVRANQGHSLEVADLDLQPILDAAECLDVIHGTYRKHLPGIMRSGLSRMGRNHIHFTTREPSHHGQVISGMRTDCEVAIYIDLPGALHSGLTFFRSSNGVILCPGNNGGFLPAKHFLRIVDRRTKEDIDPSRYL